MTYNWNEVVSGKQKNDYSPWKMAAILNGKQNLRMINITYKAFFVFSYKSTRSLLEILTYKVQGTFLNLFRLLKN